MARKSKLVRRTACAAAAALLAWASGSEAKVTKIQKLSTTQICSTVGAQQVCEFGDNKLTYEGIAGLAFGELDPKNPLNAIIQDIDLAPKNTRGNVEYVATFFLVKPTEASMKFASGLMWHDVPNRGGRITINDIEKGLGDFGLSSGWQGDNAGGTVVPANADSPDPIGTASTNDNEWVKAPVLTGVTGKLTGRTAAVGCARLGQ